MSPAPSRTSRDAIIAAGRTLLERDGLEGVSMARIAELVGVRGPSLYKHVPSRAALIRAMSEDVAAELEHVLTEAMTTGSVADDLRAAADAYRRYVRANPAAYGLLSASLGPEARPDPDAVAAVGLPIVSAMSRLGGGERALEAARTMVSWAHGFVSMEQAGAFRLGGDVDAAYAYGIEIILAGVSAREHPR
jgi:AcrR family transcriptional regulator